jgi:hypothetical protein
MVFGHGFGFWEIKLMGLSPIDPPKNQNVTARYFFARAGLAN